jgi:hypothetical protein
VKVTGVKVAHVMAGAAQRVLDHPCKAAPLTTAGRAAFLAPPAEALVLATWARLPDEAAARKGQA